MSHSESDISAYIPFFWISMESIVLYNHLSSFKWVMITLCELFLHARVTSESWLSFIARKVLKEGSFQHLHISTESVQWFLLY